MDSFKQKYLDQIDQIEQQDAKFEVLRKALIHVSLIAVGQDAKLDDYLGQLRKQLRSNENSVDLIDQQVELANNRMSQLDHDKENLAQYIGDLLHSNLDEILNNPLNSSNNSPPKQSLLALKQQLPENFKFIIEAASWLDRFLQIKKQIKSDKKRGLQVEVIVPIVWDELFEHLFRVVESLDMDKASTILINDIKQQVSEGCDQSCVIRHVASICDVILQSHHALEDEFELYLQSLVAQLVTLQSNLTSSKEVHANTDKAHDVFYSELNQHMDDLNKGVQEQEDAYQLKVLIQQKMEDLNQHVVKYSTGFKENQNKQEDHYQLLVSQMTRLESDNQKMREQLKVHIQKSQTDPLTQLPNRGKFDDVYEKEYKRYERYQTDCCIAVIDIDLFKRVNDSYGHLVGDKVLVLIANQIKQNIRESDFVARYGGEEFVVILPHTDLDSAGVAMNSVCEKIANTPFNFRSTPVSITVSIGLCAFSQSKNKATAFNQSDQAMYQAKEKGRNQICKWEG
ncbi:MAG: GGDEF domain-containing protein [Saccharospirillaceae bacterium]|nr:GGDEF domain-containing protein [Pseudomonadales bacterium]NRB80781.1 GGDEF domain-containing protein [Saccharospirillaceae bacterium]